MSKRSVIENWATFLLGLVCVFLVIRLARSEHVDARTTRPGLPSTRLGARKEASRRLRGRENQAVEQELELRLDLLKQLDAGKLEFPDHDPFAFAPTPEQVKQAIEQRKAVEMARTAPPPPAVAPPVPYKALGYSEMEQGSMEAYLADQEQVYVVHVGDEFQKRYRITKITASQVEIEDEVFHQTTQLLFPQ